MIKDYNQSLDRLLAWIALVGIATVIVTHFIGSLVVDEHDFVADTISELGIKEKAWIQDLGLDALALSYACIGIYFFRNKALWFANSLLTPLLVTSAFIAGGVLLYFIAEHNQYANRPGRGESIHVYLVTGFYLTSSIAMLLLGYFTRATSTLRRSLPRAFCWVFILMAPPFFFMPDHIDGLYEKVVAIFLLAYLIYLLLKIKQREEHLTL